MKTETTRKQPSFQQPGEGTATHLELAAGSGCELKAIQDCKKQGSLIPLCTAKKGFFIPEKQSCCSSLGTIPYLDKPNSCILGSWEVAIGDYFHFSGLAQLVNTRKTLWNTG